MSATVNPRNTSRESKRRGATVSAARILLEAWVAIMLLHLHHHDASKVREAEKAGQHSRSVAVLSAINNF
jgi:hypothetical protein